MIIFPLFTIAKAIGSCSAAASRLRSITLCISHSSLRHFACASDTAWSTAALMRASLSAHGLCGGLRWLA